MTEDPIRLSDFVPLQAQSLSVDLKTAAYDLHEMLQRLTDHYYVANGPVVPATICWLGSIARAQKSTRQHLIDFGMLNRYFSNWAVAPTPSGPEFECLIEGDFAQVPASTIYFSRAELIDWIEAADLECPQFMTALPATTPSATSQTKEEIQQDSLEWREINSVKLILSAAFELIHALSHRNSPLRSNAAKLDLSASPGLKAKDFLDLAKLAGIETGRGVNTVAKYFPDEQELELLRAQK